MTDTQTDTQKTLTPEEAAIDALCPLDGRYAPRMQALRQIMGEGGFMRERVKVEITWLIALTEADLSDIPRLTPAQVEFLYGMVKDFKRDDALKIKAIEKQLNHDVKSVERAIRERCESWPELAPLLEFIHFGCTSEDINNTSHALQIKQAREKELLPALDKVIAKMREMAHAFADIPMLSLTHGQPASPTTVGKEIANVVMRLKAARGKIASVKILAKMNGAVGNYSAHCAAYPDFNWEAFCKQVVEAEEPVGLGLTFQPYSIQIEPHDYMAELFYAMAQVNTILTDWARDAWGYISRGIFSQKLREGEVGSSVMPHKVNPIDFENGEGNLGLANALLLHLAGKLPISRYQRDLSDSTVCRNIGLAFGYSILAYDSILKALNKLDVNKEVAKNELDGHWEVMGEPIQTVMRRFGVSGGYDLMKDAMQGKKVSEAEVGRIIDSLPLTEGTKNYLHSITPSNYIGLAARLARRC